ncbi:MAG: hypothetical protein AAF479_17960 [Pseudomonadota bacterium]
MKALTIWQPWASLILHGFKPYEFRGWKVPKFVVGQRIAIHAGARKIPKKEWRAFKIGLAQGSGPRQALNSGAKTWLEEFAGEQCQNLPHGAVLATAVIGPEVHPSLITIDGKPIVNDSDRDDHFNWGWPLTEIEPVMPPVEVRGAQGFWNWRA